MTDDSGTKPINYPGNSSRQREGAKPDPKDKVVERVTTSEVVTKKKSLSRKIAESFTGDDVHSVGSYVLFEVFLPAAKTAISDAVSQGIERMLFGDSRPRSSGSRTNYAAYSRVASPSPSVRRDDTRVISSRARASHDFGEIIIADRAEAERVLDSLVELVDQYNSATVADLYALVGTTGTFVDNQWGWTDLRDSSVRRVGGGFLIDLPRTIRLD